MERAGEMEVGERKSETVMGAPPSDLFVGTRAGLEPRHAGDGAGYV
jgi:hypothetical protein